MWEEFNRRRTLGQVMDSLLTEASAAPRTVYRAMLEEFRRDGLRPLTTKYPVLERHLATTVKHWWTASRELLRRAHHDNTVLVGAFGLPAGARLVGVRQGLSDPHPGGRTVAILTFAVPGRGADQHRILYKSKDLQVDHALQQVLEHVPSPTPADVPLQRVTVIAHEGYGYMEWIPHRLCETDGSLRSFYRNAGRLTAVLYLLGCSDCHHANLIACGGQLILIDGETLFEGTPAGVDAATVGQTELHRRIRQSVLSVGMLPQWHVAAAERIARDMSALGIEPPTSARRQAPGWIRLNTDGMISGDIEKDNEPAKSLPVGIGSANRLGDFIDDFCGGFEGQMLAIMAEKTRWLDEDGPLALFPGLRRRFVRRPTWLYLWIRSQLLEPAALTSEAAQRRVLDKLALTPLHSATDSHTPALIAAETAQMADLHVPYFEQYVDGIDVMAPDGTTVVGFYATSGYDNAVKRLRELDSDSIALQVRLVRGVVAAKHMHAHRAEPGPRRASVILNLSGDDRVSAAKDLADYLVRSAITDASGAVEWLGIHATRDIERSNYGPVGASLYSGRTGIALFLATLARDSSVADRDEYRRVALGALSDVLAPPADGYRWWRDQPLGLAGSGGILLALVHLHDLVPGPMHRFVESLAVELLSGDEQLDVIFGCAGLIGPLLAVGTSHAVSLARAAGDRLIERQDQSGGWLMPAIAPQPLTGFSHGASGVAAALAGLFSATTDGRYLEAAARALHYERARFDPNAGNWPDLRAPHRPDRPRFMLGWCHGAPGIALSRLCLLDSPLWDTDVETELHHALLATSDTTSGGDSLCCGRTGRAAVLRLAARQINDRRWLDAAAQLEEQSLTTRRANGRYSFADIPGLFQGAAGLGMELIDGERLSVLPSLLSAGSLRRVLAG